MILNRTPEYFLTIAREQNISRAAEKLFISQSSLSQHLAKLEAEFGVRLFDRSRSPLGLTEAGTLYKNYLESNMFLYRRFQSDLSELNRDSAQTVNIGLGTWRGSILVPEVLPRFLEQHPHALVNLHEYPVSELLPRIQSGQIDFAVMNLSGDLLPEGVVGEVIAYERVLLVCRKDRPASQRLLSRKEDEDLQELLAEALGADVHIALGSRLTIGKAVDNFLESRNIVPDGRIVTTNNRTVLRLAAKGMGYCFMVESGLTELPVSEELCVFDLGVGELLAPLAVVQKKGSYMPPMVKALVTDIRSYYGDLLERFRTDDRIISKCL